MKTIPHSIMILRLAALLIVCWGVPPLLCHYVGPAAGVLGASGAAALWYSQYRFPAWNQRSDASFRFVASGYGVIGFTLVACLGRLIGTSLL